MRIRDFAAIALLSALSWSGLGQQTAERGLAEPLPLEPVERFSGPLPATKNPALVNARVVFRHWHISNDQRVEIPHEGFLLVHLHAGQITVLSGGERKDRQGDEFWTVQPGEKLIVQTGQDSVVLRTLETITPR